MLNTVVATQGQIEKIYSEYIDVMTFEDCYKDSVSYVLIFKRKNCRITFNAQDIDFYGISEEEMEINFFELTRDQTRYDIHYVKKSHAKLHEKLRLLSVKHIKDWKDGNLL